MVSAGARALLCLVRRCMSGRSQATPLRMPPAVHRRFLEHAKDHPDYPTDKGYLKGGESDENVIALSKKVLEVKKGSGFAAMLIEQCAALDEMPGTVKSFLDTVAADMALPKLDNTDGDAGADAGGGDNGPDDPDSLDIDVEDIP